MWINKLINKKRVQATFGISRAKLEFLSMEYLNGRATKFDSKHWEEELNNFKKCIEYIPENKSDLIYFESVYKEYLKSFFEEEIKPSYNS